MSKFARIIASAVLIGGAIAVSAGPAAAQRHGGSHHGGGYHGGSHSGYHRGGGFRHGGGWGPGIGFGFGSPYYYGGSPYYAEQPDCGWARVRVWRNHHWVIRRSWRCW